MNLVIICLDGLDPGLVREWNLKNLLQKYNGVHDIGMIEKNYTPLLFSAFLTGKNPKKYGYTYDYIMQRRNFRYNTLFKLHDYIGGTLGLRKIFDKLGFLDRQKRFIASNMNTAQKYYTFIIELNTLGKTTSCIDLPSYNEYVNDPLYRQTFWDLIKKDRNTRRKAVREILYHTLNKWHMFKFTIPHTSVSIYYSCLPDMAHHLLFKDGEIVYVKDIYLKLNDLVGSLKESDILVFSDHGFNHDEYFHSERGLWSTNYKLSDKPTSILDFHDVILKNV